MSLDAGRVAELLRTERLGRSLALRGCTDSTNDDAREAATEGAPDGHVVVADAQRAGRGSRGRSWSSPGGSDLYFSVLVRADLDLRRLPTLTLATGLGVAEAVTAFVPAHEVEIKWPNDVRLVPVRMVPPGGTRDRPPATAARKVAGVLAETWSTPGRADEASGTRAAVIGVGLNVNRRSFPPELADEAISLAQARGETLGREEVLAAVLGEVERWIDRLLRAGPESVVRALEARLALRGQDVRCGDVRGELVGLSPGGALRIRTASGVREVIAGRLEPTS